MATAPGLGPGKVAKCMGPLSNALRPSRATRQWKGQGKAPQGEKQVGPGAQRWERTPSIWEKGDTWLRLQ